jgi:hypothetical protein
VSASAAHQAKTLSLCEGRLSADHYITARGLKADGEDGVLCVVRVIHVCARSAG